MRIYAEVLAGGKGERMSNSNLPKQFLMLGDKPVIIHTIERFLECEQIDFLVVVVKSDWSEYLANLITKYNIDIKKLAVVLGGETRTDTTLNGIKYIEDKFGIFDDDIIITHDAVRPFINNEIIEDNIKYAIEYGAVDTVISSTDTIVQSENNLFITNIPDRKFMYQGQTPQSFNIKLLLECFNNLNEEQKEILTDMAKIVVLNGKKVMLVKGSEYNIKLTTPFDLIVAESILKSRD